MSFKTLSVKTASFAQCAFCLICRLLACGSRTISCVTANNAPTNNTLLKSFAAIVFLLLLSVASGSVFANQRAEDPSDSEQPNLTTELTVTLYSENIVLQIRLHPSPMMQQLRWPQQDLQSKSIATASTITTPDTHQSDWSAPEVLSGHVDGDPDSWARLLKLNNGLYLGQVYAYDRMFAVEPDSDNQTTQVTEQPSLTEQNAALLQRLQQSSNRSPSTSTTIDYLIYPPPADTGLTSRNATNDLRVTTGVDVPRVLRLGIVVDSRFDNFHNGQGLNHALSLINVIDGIYQQQLGAAIQLEAVVDYTDPQTDPMRNLQGPVENLLAAFGNVRLVEPQLPANLTMVHLFTGLLDPDGVLGLGWIGTACRTDGFDVSLSTPFEFDALLAAHEMAHNLGAGHDNTAACATDSSRLMWPRLSSRTRPEFSDCSLLAIAPGIAASCNVDNIDLAASQQMLPSVNTNEISFRFTAANLDPTRTAPSVRALIDLPAGASVAALPGNCGNAIDNNNASSGDQAVTRVICLYGDMGPGSTASVDMRLQILPSSAQQILRTQVLSPSAADTQPLNNVAQANLASNANVNALPDLTDQPGTLNDGDTTQLSAGIADDQGLVSAGGGAGVSLPYVVFLLLVLVNSLLRKIRSAQMSVQARRATA